MNTQITFNTGPYRVYTPEGCLEAIKRKSSVSFVQQLANHVKGSFKSWSFNFSPEKKAKVLHYMMNEAYMREEDQLELFN